MMMDITLDCEEAIYKAIKTAMAKRGPQTRISVHIQAPTGNMDFDMQCPDVEFNRSKKKAGKTVSFFGCSGTMRFP